MRLINYLNEEDVPVEVQCYHCGYKTKRKKKPEHFKCPKCKSTSFRWNIIRG